MFYFLLPTSINYRTRRYPWVTFSFMGICLLFYLLSWVAALQGDAAEEAYFKRFWCIPALGYAHTYLTNLFVHADIWHFLGNMVYLFLFGCCIEDILGRLHYIWFYLLGGLIATVTLILLHPSQFDSFIPIGGASGAIAACQGAFLMILPRAELNIFYFYFIFFRVGHGEFQVPAWSAIAVWFLFDLIGLLMTLDREGGGVAFAAHIGGFVFGAITMVVCKRIGIATLSLEDDEDQFDHPKSDFPVSPTPPAARASRAVAPEDHDPNIYLHDNGTESGPFSRAQILSMMDLGTLDETAFYWKEGMSDWESVEELI